MCLSMFAALTIFVSAVLEIGLVIVFWSMVDAQKETCSRSK